MKLKTIAEQISDHIITPDDIWNGFDSGEKWATNIAFIFIDRLFYQTASTLDTHLDIINSHLPQIIEILRQQHLPPIADQISYEQVLQWYTVKPELGLPPLRVIYDDLRRAKALFGRIASESSDPKANIIAFWAADNRRLNDCLTQLYHDGHITAKTTISFPGIGTGFINNFIDNNKFNYDDSFDELRELHLSRPDRKKRHLRKLGWVGGKKSKWQQAAEQAKIIAPGQKWWAMQSEGV